MPFHQLAALNSNFIQPFEFQNVSVTVSELTQKDGKNVSQTMSPSCSSFRRDFRGRLRSKSSLNMEKFFVAKMDTLTRSDMDEFQVAIQEKLVALSSCTQRDTFLLSLVRKFHQPIESS